MVCFFKYRSGALHIMEVAINDCCNRCIGYFAQTTQRLLHLFFRFTCVNCNYALGRKDEGLV